jgi:hypothetical protein
VLPATPVRPAEPELKAKTCSARSPYGEDERAKRSTGGIQIWSFVSLSGILDKRNQGSYEAAWPGSPHDRNYPPKRQAVRIDGDGIVSPSYRIDSDDVAALDKCAALL